MHYGMFSSLRRLHTPGKSPLPLNVKIPNVSRDCQMSPGGTTILSESQILCEHSWYYLDYGQPLQKSHPSIGSWGCLGGPASDTPFCSPCMRLRGRTVSQTMCHPIHCLDILFQILCPVFFLPWQPKMANLHSIKYYLLPPHIPQQQGIFYFEILLCKLLFKCFGLPHI